MVVANADRERAAGILAEEYPHGVDATAYAPATREPSRRTARGQTNRVVEALRLEVLVHIGQGEGRIAA